jgi:hypothetical protein
VNVATTDRVWSTVTRQVVLVPLHPPVQSTKWEPASGASLSVTWVPEAKPAVQVCPQMIPSGSLVTVPVPSPGFETESSYPCRMVTVVEAELFDGSGSSA